MEVEIGESSVTTEEDVLLLSNKDSASQCTLLCDSLFSVERLENNSAAMQYYTRFDNFNNFIYVFNVLGPATGHIGLANCGLSPPNQFFLTLMKLRQAKDDYEIGLLMGVSKKTVSNIFTVWVNFLYYQLK